MQRFQILSLDGGGIKGLFSAAFLAHLEQDHKTRIADHFDLITGTSTGGIIALALGLGLRPSEIVEFYKQQGPRIFASTRLASLRHYAWGPKYGQDQLSGALRSVFKESTLNDSTKRLVVPSCNLEKGEVYVFKTKHIERYKRDHLVPMWQVALATSSAPTYFPACREVESLRLVDGGVRANNPVMCAVVEAIGPLEIPRESIRVLSLGTSYTVKLRPEVLDTGGIARWVGTRAMIDLPFAAQSHAMIGQAQLLVGHENVRRVDPVVPDGVLELDRLDFPRLLAEAAHLSRNESPTIGSMFLGHKAPPFSPVPAEPSASVPIR